MKEIASNIDFADSSYISCETHKENLIVRVSSWDEKEIEITFINAIQFTYKQGSLIAGLYEKTNEKTFLEEILSRYFVKIPEDNPFKIYVILDIEDFVFFEIVAESILVLKNDL